MGLAITNIILIMMQNKKEAEIFHFVIANTAHTVAYVPTYIAVWLEDFKNIAHNGLYTFMLYAMGWCMDGMHRYCDYSSQ